MSFLSRRSVWLATGVLLALVLAWMAWSGRDGEVRWLARSPGNAPARFAFLGKWRPKVSGTWNRVKRASLGKPAIISIKGAICELESIAPLLASTNVLWRRTNSMGDQLWLIADAKTWTEELGGLAGHRFVSRPNITAVEKQQSQIATYQVRSVGHEGSRRNQNVGWRADLWAKRAGQGTVELTCFVSGNEVRFRPMTNSTTPKTESFLHTNFAFGARVELPLEHSLFLITHETNSSGKLLTVLLTPSVQ